MYIKEYTVVSPNGISVKASTISKNALVRHFVYHMYVCFLDRSLLKGLFTVPQDYKDTMNLPQTDFPMRGNLPTNEPLRLEKWQQIGLYHLMLQKNDGNEPYVLHDGPPYANGPIHMGHAFNKVLKDIIVKYKAQRGFYAPYVPGWDCHGQPIEHMVETKLGPEKMARIDQPTLRRLCREWAEKYVSVQRDGFIRLGVLGEWEDPYLTYAYSYEAGNVEIFKQMYKNGAIYRGRKPIHWCYQCHTALAEAEIEYGEEASPSIYVAFDMVEGAAQASERLQGLPVQGAKGDVPLRIVIWTTTPWTLPANTAVTVAPDADYALLLHEGSALVVAEELLGAVAAALGIEEQEKPACLSDHKGERILLKGADLSGLTYTHPIHAGMTGRIVTGSHVDMSTGTGAVHTAPGHGQEDYLMGVKHDLPLLMPVDDNGVFDAGGGPFEGQGVVEANPAIVAFLREQGLLLAEYSIDHSYPHCWRCHSPVIFRATDQWFVSMEATGLREKAISEAGRLNWYPAWAVNRMRSMLEGRPDWCISRQRSWGVPIPVFKCAQCSTAVATDETFDAVIDLFNREGSDAWFTREPAEYLPADTACGACGCTELVPERDILDVWWESGVSHTSVLKKRDYLQFPADLYLEGSDQHRGWFQSSLLTSVGTYGVAPYKGVLSCGFVNDGEGNKMSKSRGNVIDPQEVFNKFGADVLRLWVGSIDSSQDVGIDEEVIQRTSEAYRRIRNTFRFLLSNLYDFDSASDCACWDELGAIDRWALVRCMRLTREVTDAFDAYRFHVAFHALYDYIVTDLSAVYLDVLKDRLYSGAPKSVGRRAAQTVLLNILEVLVRVLAPVLTFTCDEAWEYYPEAIQGTDGLQRKAVLLAGWPLEGDFVPAPPTSEEAHAIEEAFSCILGVREAVTKALEEARVAREVGKSQEAALRIVVAPEAFAVLKGQAPGLLEELFIVASVDLEAGQPEGAASVFVSKAPGEKCPRCWNIRELGTDERHSEVCARCAEVLEGRAV